MLETGRAVGSSHLSAQFPSTTKIHKLAYWPVEPVKAACYDMMDSPTAGPTMCKEPSRPRPGWDWKSDDEFMARLTRDLRKAAAAKLKSGLNGLSVYSLAQESLLRLVKAKCLQDPEDRAYLYGVACKAMQNVILDHVRRKNTLKRKADRVDIELDLAVEALKDEGIDILELHEALGELFRAHERQAKAIDLHFFGNYKMEEIGSMLGVSPRTAESDCRQAREWLRRYLER